MSEHAVAQPQRANTPQEAAKDPSLLRRREMLQPEQSPLLEWMRDNGSGNFAGTRFGYDFSRVPAISGLKRPTRSLLRSQPEIQRSPKDKAFVSSSCHECTEAGSPGISVAEPTAEITPTVPEAAPAPAEAQPRIETPAPEETAAPRFIVEDSVETVGPGRMPKSEFLAQLRTEVNRAAEAAMEGTGRTTADCPYLVYWFGYYSLQDSAHIERAIRRYAPETANATTASGYIPIIAGRIRRAVETWVGTGEITGVPEGVSTSLPGGPPATEEEGAATVTGPVIFKAREGGAREPDDPSAIRRELGEGRPLEGAVRDRMEFVFGTDFSHVRTHTDTKAASLSDRFNARAFTVGRDIAFGSGEYQPGTLIGDALMAHELAHVIQQTDVNTAVAHMRTGDTDYNMLEKDADRAAMGAVSTLWSRTQESMTNIVQTAIPRLRSGLKIQRCQQSSTTSTAATTSTASTATTTSSTGAATTTLPTVVVGNFRNTGSTSPENRCPNCPRSLGIRTTDWKNGMELRGDISGHVSAAQYDFKRTKERGTWKKVGTTWTQLTHVPSGTNDDHSDNDEDLTPHNNHIYAEDIPGFRAGAPVSDASATEAVYKASFIEWVNVKVGTGSWTKRSNEFEWHSISWVEKVGGHWRRKARENEIDTGSTTVGTGDP